MWGIIPAAGRGTRIQPLGFSKELLPLGCEARPRAVAEYLVERMLLGGADRLCFTIAPEKADILAYFGGRVGGADICYAVQPQPRGLCDAIFRAGRFVGPDDEVLIGLPDTIWFPGGGYRMLPDGELSLLVFDVPDPGRFDVVCTDAANRVLEIQVKAAQPRSRWIWGAMKMPGRVLHELAALWEEPRRGDEYLGTLLNAYLAEGGSATAVPSPGCYIDVGTPAGYEEALRVAPSGESPVAHPPAPRPRSSRA